MTSKRQAINPKVQAIYDQIGTMAFANMRTSTFSLDKRKNALQWKMKRSPFKAIRVECESDGHRYQVSFFLINQRQFTEVVIEQVEAERLVYTIERMTSLHLSATNTLVTNQ